MSAPTVICYREVTGMPAHKPEELDELFAQALNSGDLDALVALYEPQACFNSEPGQVVTGPQAIRETLSGFLAMIQS